MKIMLGSDTYPPDVNGAARFTERLATGLAACGHEVQVVCPSYLGPAGREEINGVIIHRVVSHRYPLHDRFRVCLPWQAMPATAALVRTLAPDIVHVQAHFVVGRGLAVAADQAGVPLVATNHFMPENLVEHARVPKTLQRAASRLAWRDVAQVFGRAEVLTAPTPRAVELLERSTGLTEVQAISCGIDIASYAAATAAAPVPAPDQAPMILYVGRLDSEKRVNELLHAVALLPADLRCEVEIVGDGSCRTRWMALATTLGIGDHVRFRGFVSETELLEAYGRCDIFCMPGVAELQSLVTLEAMAAGKPVLAADAMALPHLVCPGRNGWLYSPGQPAELSVYLARLLRHPALRRQMGAASAEMVAEHGLDRTLDAFEGIYDRLLRHQPQLAA